MTRDDPFDLGQSAAYQHWRERTLAAQPKRSEDLIVDVQDPYALQKQELLTLTTLCQKTNMALYRSAPCKADKGLVVAVGRQLGLRQLDGNWLADEDGISPIAVAQQGLDRPAFIPYTNRPIQWHTDGYYQPPDRLIRGMVLHCVRPALRGGETALLNPDLAYIALRDANPAWVAALMAPEAMTIPARMDEDGVARAAQSGPVFSVNPADGRLHMRYTARTRSIVWHDDPTTRAAVAFLHDFLHASNPHIHRLRLQAGMGLVCNNVLHDRSGFEDSAEQPRLLYRARYLERVADPDLSAKSASNARLACVSSS